MSCSFNEAEVAAVQGLGEGMRGHKVFVRVYFWEKALLSKFVDHKPRRRLGRTSTPGIRWVPRYLGGQVDWIIARDTAPQVVPYC